MLKRIIALVVIVVATTTVSAQRRGAGPGNPQFDPGPQKTKYDGRWAFVRLRYKQTLGRGGPSWAHDYPSGEPGFWTVDDKEAANLRAFLQKGGLIIFDDFHSLDRAAGGGDDWPYFERAMKTVLPDAKIMDLDIKNPLFHSFFDVPSFDVVHNMYDPGQPVFRGIYEDNDPKKRLLAIINYNTDVSEYWEYSATGFNPVSDTNQAYQIGVNWIIYGMTH